jgi:hypothetical protein
MLTQACLSVPEKRRPSARVLSQVGQYLAAAMRDSKGYTDETEQQVADGLQGTLSLDTVGNALQALSLIWVPIRRGAKGSGTRRVFVFHDPKGLLSAMPPQRDYPAEITTNDNGKTMPPQRENSAAQRGYPVTPEVILNTDPPASAEAGLCSPEPVAQPTTPCRLCADATESVRENRLVNAVNLRCNLSARSKGTERTRKAARILLAHYPTGTNPWLVDVLCQWEPLSLLNALHAHDNVLRLARQTPEPTKDTA